MVKDLTAGRIISGAADAGAFITWLMYRKDISTPDEKKKDEEDWENGGCKSCLAKIAKAIIFCLLFSWIMA